MNYQSCSSCLVIIYYPLHVLLGCLTAVCLGVLCLWSGGLLLFSLPLMVWLLPLESDWPQWSILTAVFPSQLWNGLYRTGTIAVILGLEFSFAEVLKYSVNF